MADEPLAIEDYALIGDCRTAALVGRNGSIDWLCWPHFDSDACFAALLGAASNGRWRLAPADGSSCTRRTYQDDTLILETEFETAQGRVAVIDFMPAESDDFALIRRVEGRGGSVDMRLHLALRFEYGSVIPWVTRLEDGGGVMAVGGPNRVVLRTSIPLRGEGAATVADFAVAEGQTLDFVMNWSRSHLPVVPALDAGERLATTQAFWREWSGRCGYQGAWRAPVLRSLITLKALSFTPTGAIVAAPTTSLPEALGGERNWDYRYCWLRDATLTLIALMAGGYTEEAANWGGWLHRAVAGDPDDMQIMYGIGGERRLMEWSPGWLPGYQGAAPVRIGNAASSQLQLDTFGEVMGALSLARRHGLDRALRAWPLQVKLLERLEKIWEEPDDGIWEVRGGRRQFTHSKVMTWVAMDAAVRDAETFKLEGPLQRWRALRDHMHAVVCEKGFNARLNSFTQSFGGEALDASLLLIPQTGFLPPDDPRVCGTVQAIERELLMDGLVLRYRTEAGGDGLPPGEGAFLPCSFWLASVYQQQGRHAEAKALFERLLGLRNDVGLLSEEYDAKARRQTGNFPQAYSHLALVAAALTLDGVSLVEARQGAP